MSPSRRSEQGPGQPGVLGGEQVEGHHAVAELLRCGRRRIREVWLGAGARGPAVDEIERLAARSGARVVRKADPILANAAATSAPQGVIAWASPVRAVALDAVLSKADPFLVCLDGVTDPGNFGSVLRSALCAGVDGVVIGRHRSAALTPAAVKAAAGAVEHLPIAAVGGIPSALQTISRAGTWVIGMDGDGPEDLWSSRALDGSVALVMGAEGQGLSPLVRRRCDALVRIPQTSALGSMNVAAAAAVACFEVARRRREGAGAAR
ncbi:MAG TPA: RNA methyltransferase [Acidimicrobiales bacterium]|nr:RNA methyltransferase [Acidimicrobiales bacterium]